VSTPIEPKDKKVPRSRWRWLGRWLFRIAFCYLGVLIVLLFLENALLFHPVRDTRDWNPPPPECTVDDVFLDSADGNRIHGWWFPVAGSQGALLYFHGNAGNLSNRGKGARDLTQALGESLLIIDYPGFGKSTGKPSEASCYAAGNAAYDWLTQTKQIAPEQIILYGKSLGGGIATELAVNRPHRALVLVKTFTSVPDVAQCQFPFLPARWLVKNRFDNLEKIGRCQGPVLIAQADCDEMIPHSHAGRLFEAAGQPKQLYVLEDCSHNSAMPWEFLTTLAEFLRVKAPTAATSVRP